MVQSAADNKPTETGQDLDECLDALDDITADSC